MIAGIDYTGITVSFLCHDGEGNFLLHKRSQHTRDEHGKWDWGGGKLEFGETIQEGLAREIKEEYGCNIVSVDEAFPPTVWNGVAAGRKSHWIVLTHIIRVNREEVKNNEPLSIDEIGWFKFSNFPEPLHRGLKFETKEFQDIIKKYSK